MVGLKDHFPVVYLCQKLCTLGNSGTIDSIGKYIHDYKACRGLRRKQGNVEHVDKLGVISVHDIIDMGDILLHVCSIYLRNGRTNVRLVIIKMPACFIKMGQFGDTRLYIRRITGVDIKFLPQLAVHKPKTPFLLPLLLRSVLSYRTGIPDCPLYWCQLSGSGY